MIHIAIRGKLFRSFFRAFSVQKKIPLEITFHGVLRFRWNSSEGIFMEAFIDN